MSTITEYKPPLPRTVTSGNRLACPQNSFRRECLLPEGHIQPGGQDYIILSLTQGGIGHVDVGK